MLATSIDQSDGQAPDFDIKEVTDRSPALVWGHCWLIVHTSQQIRLLISIAGNQHLLIW